MTGRQHPISVPAGSHAPVTFSPAARRALNAADRAACPSGKVAYSTHRKALRVLEALRASGGGEQAVYRCRLCGQHHLTSQTAQGSKQRARIFYARQDAG